ncbi:5-oxoprolinase subunit PxpB [Paenibacillus athensensis]|uniref:Carboxyltransferase domain-containing protein n=1 Tax=Paenibacillus athensensis TaxID=1967502 RepID=A0A4Y8PXQ8_9BACL|nr:5-oxoprolinase subunit PxpB [Paenibacillus athensensis]MCD1259335.1 5-oxoprolinase subunit PxpB [Paenibacillus athensensis]
MSTFELYPLGDSALTVRLGEVIAPGLQERVRRLAAYIEERRFPGMIEQSSAYAALTIFYDPWVLYEAADRSALPCELAEAYVRELLDAFEREAADDGPAPGRLVKLPVCYGGEYGPDLPEVAAVHGLTEQEVVALHSGCEYPVYMIGFAPGFAYLGGLPDKLATPRRSTPRTRIEPGSVGIGGSQTGVYPLATPGGWNLIGRTPLALFLPRAAAPSLLEAGDRVRFIPITPAQFAEQSSTNGEEAPDEY